MCMLALNNSYLFIASYYRQLSEQKPKDQAKKNWCFFYDFYFNIREKLSVLQCSTLFISFTENQS